MNKKIKNRIIRISRHIAQKEYSCNFCVSHNIYPGEGSELWVWVAEHKRTHRLWVDRKHMHCPFDPLDEEEWNSELKKMREEQRNRFREMPLAA